jgi:hypothetical protein
VVATLDVDVRPDRLEQVDRAVVLEDGHVFHAADRRDHRRPVLGRADWPIRSLEPAHGLVGIDPDDEHVAEGRGLLKAFNVAAVKDVETTIGEDDPVACAAMPGKAAGQEVNGPDRIKSPFFEPHVTRTTLASLFAARYPASRPANSPAPMSLTSRRVSRPYSSVWAPPLVVPRFGRKNAG